MRTFLPTAAVLLLAVGLAGCGETETAAPAARRSDESPVARSAESADKTQAQQPVPTPEIQKPAAKPDEPDEPAMPEQKKKHKFTNKLAGETSLYRARRRAAR